MTDSQEVSGQFYRTLSDDEAKRVLQFGGQIRDYLEYLDMRPHLIAGVGGVLRREDPTQARDIDLAVVGLKYAPIGEHEWSAVEQFSTVLATYFGGLLIPSLKLEGLEGRDIRASRGSGARLGVGSGPLADWKWGFDGPYIEATADLESFGRYNSKGLQVVLRGLRPIDIQFAFNRTIDEWVREQEEKGWPYEVLFRSE